MTKSSGYTHLNYQMRDWLSMLLLTDRSLRNIAEILGVHHSTLSREIRRNGIRREGKLYYDPIQAEERAQEVKRKSRGNKISRCPELQEFLENRLQDSWSPDSISGYLKANNHAMQVSHETIYTFIYREKRDWIKYLAQGNKQRRRKNKYGNRRRVLIPDRVSIERRPASVEKRQRIGHFEADTMVCRSSKDAILVLVERKTRKIKLEKLERKTAVNVAKGIVKHLKPFRDTVKSITYDNGSENTLHEKVNKQLDCKSYFCHPYHSWEKGSVEQAIGLVRRFIPKKTDLSKISSGDLIKIEKKINSRPRKILGYRTPDQIFHDEWCT